MVKIKIVQRKNKIKNKKRNNKNKKKNNKKLLIIQMESHLITLKKRNLK